MSDKKVDATDGCLILVMGMMFIPFSFVINGMILSCGWAWYVVPLGAPQLSYVHLLGLDVLAGFVCHQVNSSSSEISADKFAMHLWIRTVVSMMSWFFMWVLHFWM